MKFIIGLLTVLITNSFALASERAWITYRNLTCDLLTGTGGTGASYLFYVCKIHLAKNQIQTLNESLKTLTNPNGSQRASW